MQQFIHRYLKSNNFIKRYAIAVGSVVAMLILRAFLHPILGERSQYTIFLLAVLVTVRYSGSVPALVALALGAFLGNTFFDQPYFIFKLGDLKEIWAVLLYLTIGLAIIYIFSLLKRREGQLADQIIKQTEVENALRLSEDRFRLATEALHGLIYEWDLTTDATYRSSGLADIVGYQVGEVPITGDWWRDRIHPDDAESVTQKFAKAIAAHEPRQSNEYRIRHKDGSYRWVWDNNLIFYNTQGQIVRLVGSTLSIDERKQLTGSLTRSEDRFRLVTEALEGAIYDWDAITGIAYRSSGLFEIIGYRPDEVANTRTWWLEQIHPDDYAGVQQSLQKRLAEHAPTHSVEYRIRHKNGQLIWVWDRSRLLYNAEGQLTRISGITLSIDERMKLAESLAQTEERFRVAFENATDAMALSDADGIVLAANQAYFQLYGYPAEEVLGQNYAIIFPEETRPESMERYKAVFHEQRDLPSYESTVKRRDGTVRIVEARVGFIETQGKRQFMLSVVRDLTERKQNENALYSRYWLTADLAQAVTVEDVAQAAVDHLMQQWGAIAGNIYLYDSEDDSFDLLYANAALASSEAMTPWRHFPADPSYLITEVVKHNKSLWFSSGEAAETASPHMKQFSRHNLGASVRLPLVGAEEVFGAISLIFPTSRTFTEDEQALITSLVIQCAQALERAQLAEKAQALAVIEERHRLARDLHDNVSQLLFSSSVISEMLPRLLTKKPETAIKQAEELHLMVRGAMAEMRTLLWELRPENILQTKLSGLLTQLAYAAEARQDIKVSLVVRANNEFILPADAQVTFYRIAQESIHNVLKHGQATTIAIQLRQMKRYTALVIRDNGHGFVVNATSGGFGLRNMQERATKIDAQFGIKSQVGKGTRTRLLWKSES